MASKTLYVGNIPYSASEQDLFDHFSAFSPTQARIVQGRGFAFVDVAADQCEDAIEKMNQSDMQGRRLTVSEARPKEGGGGGGGGFRSGGGGGGGYGGGGGGRSGGGGYGGGGGRRGGGGGGGGGGRGGDRW